MDLYIARTGGIRQCMPVTPFARGEEEDNVIAWGARNLRSERVVIGDVGDSQRRKFFRQAIRNGVDRLQILVLNANLPTKRTDAPFSGKYVFTPEMQHFAVSFADVV